jgi:hypothetical protein
MIYGTFCGEGIRVRLAFAIPGIIWLLLPPICICHLPEKLAGMYHEPSYPQNRPENDDHIPGCPAAKRIMPHNFAECEFDTSDIVESHQSRPFAQEKDNFASGIVMVPPQDDFSGGQRLFLVHEAFLL